MKTKASLSSSQKRLQLPEIISLLLLVFFVHTSVAIYIQFQSLIHMLVFYTNHTTVFAWIIFITNIIIAILLFIPRTRFIGLISAAFFAISGIITMVLTPHNPHDFGGVINELPTKQRYILYSIIALIAIINIFLTLQKAKLKSPEQESQIAFT